MSDLGFELEILTIEAVRRGGLERLATRGKMDLTEVNQTVREILDSVAGKLSACGAAS